MTLLRSIRLGFLHVAVAMTFVLINGVLNRVMIHDLGILASIVAVLVVLPYLLSPIQVLIGQHSDTHPILGYRRTPYIVLGMALILGGTLATPYVALLMASDFAAGILLGLLAFGAWGFGFNLAVVGYLSLASDLSSEVQRPRTISVMWFMMIVSVIVTAIITSRLLDPFSNERLFSTFGAVCGMALVLTLIGIIGLEPRSTAPVAMPERESQMAAIQAVLANPQARLFFVYLILMLAAILGQDILLEPFGAAAFGITVRETTQLTAIWGGATLLALLLQGFVFSRIFSKKIGAAIGAVLAASGLTMIGLSGLTHLQPIFIPGIALLGFGTGIATSTNLALMLDMTTAEQAGLFIGAWGVADALARGVGILMGGVVRDIITVLTGDLVLGYIVVFLIEAALLALSLMLLQRIDVRRFRNYQPTFTELVAAADA